ncbi:hypothetical protein [Neisseria lactamica]|uniref:hypothetical protein n=1 Tax=Neisseria lactamica TaxID=486 RepID=UPI001863BE2F|nr:hypothetical protein [Neisseria lactamica]
MTPFQFCQTQIDEWMRVGRYASETGDIALFERVEKEIANYQMIQKRYATDGNNINKGG